MLAGNGTVLEQFREVVVLSPVVLLNFEQIFYCFIFPFLAHCQTHIAYAVEALPACTCPSFRLPMSISRLQSSFTSFFFPIIFSIRGENQFYQTRNCTNVKYAFCCTSCILLFIFCVWCVL